MNFVWCVVKYGRVRDGGKNMMEWKDPPRTRRTYTKNRYLEDLKVLMKKPGKWARLDTFTEPAKANSTRSNLKSALTRKRYKMPNGAEGFNWTFSVQKDEWNPIWGLYAKCEKDLTPTSEVDTIDGTGGNNG